MFRFRPLIQFTLLTIALTSAVGCWKPTEKGDPHNGKSGRDATASFFITKVWGKAVTPRSEGQIWKVANKKEIFVTACAIDRKASKEIKGHKFSVEILEANRRIDDLVTDESGCFTWSEIIEYNQLAVKPYYIEVQRRIHGQGVHVGFRDIALEINPWAGERGIDKQNAVIYRKLEGISETHKANEGMDAALSGASSGQALLWMSDVTQQITLRDESDEDLRKSRDQSDGRLTLEEKKNGKIEVSNATQKNLRDENGALLEVLLSMRPKFKVQGLDGQEEDIPIKHGQFKVWVQLIATDLGDNRKKSLLLTPNLVPGVGNIIDGKLESAVRLGLSRRVTRGRLEMAVKVVPIGLANNVKPFEALYVLGDIDSILGSQRAFYSPKNYEGNTKFDYSQYVAQADNFDELKKNMEAHDFEPFIFETASVMFAGIAPGETATTRTIDYKVQTCVRDTLTGRRVQFQKFQVFDETGNEIVSKDRNGNVVPTMTNQEGCLIWNSSLTHKYYKPEEFFFPKFKIVHARSGETLAKVKELVINPWDAMFRTFGFDRIEFSNEFIENIKKRKKIVSRLFVPRYSYHAIRFSYKIDQFMELSVKKQILLNIRPEVLRYSGIIGGRKVTEPLRDGIYLMRVAIQKDYLDPADKGNKLFAGRDRNGAKTTSLEMTGTSVPKHFVSVEQKLVRVNGGEINTPIQFSMQDLRLMRVRSQFFVELEPINEQSLEFARVIAQKNKEKLEALQKDRMLSDEQRSEKIDEHRRLIGEAVKKIQSKLADMPGGLINVNRLREMKNDELKEFDLTEELAKEVIEDLKLNDFTLADASPVVSLDILTESEESSGLGKRTFVGPIIFLSNAYSDDLRPTDNLDEFRCGTVTDCGEFKYLENLKHPDTNVYSNSQYYGSIRHFYGKHVDSLIVQAKSNEAEYNKLMPALSSLANYADLYNFKLMSLKDENFTRIQYPCKTELEKCRRSADDVQIKVDTFLKAINSSEIPSGQNLLVDNRPFIPREEWSEFMNQVPVTKQDLKKLIETGRMTRWVAAKMCGFYAYNLGKIVGGGIGAVTQKDVLNDCVMSVIRKNASRPVYVDRKIRVFKTDDYVYMGGKQLNYNVGASFSFSHNESVSFGRGLGVDFMDFPFVGKLFTGALTGFQKPFSAKLGVDMNSNHSQNDGTSVGESTYLVTQAANFVLKLDQYEKCGIVTFDPRVSARAMRSLQYIVKSSEVLDRAAGAIHSGVMICSGEKETKPIKIRESYYYFTQHFTEGDMLDQGDLYNHPWLLAMRGVRDFRMFTFLMRAREFDFYSPTQPVVEKPGWALDQMVDVYRKVMPSFPGLFTIISDKEDIREYPFSENLDAHKFVE